MSDEEPLNRKPEDKPVSLCEMNVAQCKVEEKNRLTFKNIYLVTKE